MPPDQKKYFKRVGSFKCPPKKMPSTGASKMNNFLMSLIKKCQLRIEIVCSGQVDITKDDMSVYTTRSKHCV